MSGLFSLDDVKLLYAASQIKDGDDEKKSASLVPKMQMNLFSKSKDPKGHTEEEEEEEEDGSAIGETLQLWVMMVMMAMMMGFRGCMGFP